MAITQVTYTGNNSTTNYSFSFPYLDDADIKVELDGVLQTVTTNYTFANATTIQFVTAPANGALIRIYRETDIEDTQAEFYPGSSIRAQNLNDNFDQSLYALQEVKNQYQTLYEPVFPDDLDMDGNQINNLGEPTLATDAATKNYVDTTTVASAGDTMTGNLAMSGNRVTGLGAPANGQDAVNKNYADNTFVDAAGDTMSGDLDMDGNLINNVGTPVAGTDAANKDYVDTNTWNVTTETLQSGETWTSNDSVIATAEAIDDRIDFKIDTALTSDIATDGTGITITDDGDGTITLGLGANSIDFDRIRNADIITQAEQNAGSPNPLDTNLFTALAASRRFDTLVQTAVPTGSNWETGKTWLQNDQDLTLSVWNGSAWTAVASGGAFTSQPKVVYVDANSGDDANDGHRISTPKLTIKSAIDQINADAVNGEGSVVVVAPGIYQEVAPIDITQKDVSIIGEALRSCIVHPTVATQQDTLFRVNSGTYIANLTLTGMKASGTRGNSTIDGDATYGLPENQGWNFAFYPGAVIEKSPYIQNCTNFSDSEIDNAALDPHSPAGGGGGDIDSAMTGGGLLIDGSVPDANSPLRSMVCDSYTHVGLDGPGILVTNNGYCQATSSYSFFTHYHIKCRDGGQANLAASTTDFGRYSLIADGRSQNAIFTSTTSALANDGDITFTINAPTVGSPWHGSATRPQSNMLVDIGGNTYPILSATANGTGWDVTISRPDPANKSNNLGLDGAVASGSAVSFYLRSMIASSGHTMEYVGSGTNYNALPENGGVPIEANQVIELNDGKVWAAITDHNGKFKLGDTLTVDQQIGYVTIPSGSIAFDLASDQSPQLSADLDAANHKLTNVTDPTSAQDAATKNYVDTIAGSTSQIFEDDSSVTVNDDGVNPGEVEVTVDGGIVANFAASGTNHYTAFFQQDNLHLTDQNQLRFWEATANGTNSVGFNGPANIASDVTWTLPATDGSSNQALTTNGSSTLSWVSFLPSSGGTMTGNITFNGGQTFPGVLATTGGTVTGDVTLDNQSDLRFGEATANGTNWVAFQAPSNIASNVTWTLPSTDATVSGHALKSDAAGNLSWGTAGGATGGGTDDVFYENSNTVTQNYTITNNKNAMSAGPITINSGVTVTVGDGENWVIL